MIAARVDAIRNLTLEAAAKQWRGYRRSGVFARLFNKLVGFHPPDRLRITEHHWDDGASGLSETAIHAWSIDDSGLSTAPVSQHDEEYTLRGMYFSVFAIRFGISQDARRMQWEEISGPRAGIALEYSLSDDGAPPRIERSKMLWRS